MQVVHPITPKALSRRRRCVPGIARCQKMAFRAFGCMSSIRDRVAAQAMEPKVGFEPTTVGLRTAGATYRMVPLRAAEHD